MKNKKKKRKGFNASAMRCPYCGASVVYRSADGIYQNNDKGAMLYVCSHYPACDAYVRVHAGTKLPVGSIASIETICLFQDSVKYTMKSSKCNACPRNSGKFQKPFFHFYSCCPGKSHNKNRGSRYLPFLDHMCCSFYYDGSFPRTGACQNHHRS